MRVVVNGAEKFCIWKRRFKLNGKDISKITGGVSEPAIAMWAMGTTIPNAEKRVKLYNYSKRITLKGTYRLVLSSNSWFVKSPITVFVNEALWLWRNRRELNLKEIADAMGVTQMPLSKIERGEVPTKFFKDLICKYTDGYIPVEAWEKEQKYLEQFL